MKRFRISLTEFDTEKRYYDEEKRFFTYDSLKSWELPPKEFKNLDEAKIWLLDNFADYFFGSCINCIDDDCNDFVCYCVPEYYEHIYQTSDRKYIIEKIKEEGFF